MRSHKIFQNLLLGLGSIGFTLVAVEFALRFSDYVLQVGYHSRLGTAFVKDALPGVPFLHEPYSSYSQHWPSNPNGYFDEVSNGVFYHVNNEGFRGADFSRKRDRMFRIAFLGDSFCWGDGVKQADHFLTRLDEQLNNNGTHGEGFEILNFGVGSFNTADEVALFREYVVDYQPDICVILYFLNDTDADDAVGTMTYLRTNEYLPEYRQRFFVLDMVVAPLERYVRSRALIERYVRAHEAGSPEFQVVARSLREFSELCAAHRIVPGLIVHPILYKLNESYPFASSHQTVMMAARELGIEALDLFPTYQGHDPMDLWVHAVDQHPNHIAHQMISQSIYPFLRGMIEERHEWPNWPR